MALSQFELLLSKIHSFPILKDLELADYTTLDLSVANAALKSVDVSSSDALENYIWNYIKTQDAKAAYGGYLEQRGIYERSNYFNKVHPDEERNIHLGLDLWIESNTAIHAPLEGIIHSFNNNTNHGDYGPTIILSHQFEGLNFYSLYGHLSLASIKGLQIGMPINKAQEFARLGTAEVNGDYPPHLHFQIIKDIQHYKGDYPGVSNKIDLEFYKMNCPDPNLLLKLS
ncbi:MAG: peptidoglycan DD-metalloendopeptidase family protein [Winogradskyella sp.]|uniref:peptidoglycan DD-metalloendopeptidase family protein n=1 Tax=Winogradskyella sp. TaxID=1883156 RepID=UPI0025F92EE7|nr:peptidoglycan DD-metalloendopeptidase family protein [Winogradskyella sp.]NRB82748.1 peptidoglycan DD-metalloendopeptidase family protein [Winogradskyella sp.]